MAKDKKDEQTTPKPLAWLHGEIKTPPFTEEARKEAGYLLRLLQQGEKIGMPQAEHLPIVGPCKKRLKDFDEAVKKAAKESPKNKA